MKIPTYIVNSFGVDESGGNPAGVVLDSENLSDAQKQSIAARMGLSETAFVEPSTKADFKVRFFTPTSEVDLCGHATIATYALLYALGRVAPGKYTQELKAGILAVEVMEGGFIFMEQALPEWGGVVDEAQLVSAHGAFPEKISTQIVSTGLKDIMLHVEGRKDLFDMTLDLTELAKLNKNTDSVGLHAYTFETVHPDSVAHCRNFAPLYGIDEESATGSSNGALACLLFREGRLAGKSLEMMRFEQGYSMGKPSEIFVTLKVRGSDIIQVQVGGRAVVLENTFLEL